IWARRAPRPPPLPLLPLWGLPPARRPPPPVSNPRPPPAGGGSAQTGPSAPPPARTAAAPPRPPPPPGAPPAAPPTPAPPPGRADAHADRHAYGHDDGDRGGGHLTDADRRPDAIGSRRGESDRGTRDSTERRRPLAWGGAGGAWCDGRDRHHGHAPATGTVGL